MSQPATDRMTLGRRLLAAAPRVAQSLANFHAWLPSAAAACPDNAVVLVVEDGKVVAARHPLGIFEVHEEIGRVGETLVARLIFCKPVSALRERPLPIYVIRVHEEGAFFGDGADAAPFEIDPLTDSWLPRNILRLGYELAIAATATEACAEIGGRRGSGAG